VTERDLLDQLTTVNEAMEELELKKTRIFHLLCECWKAQGVNVSLEEVSHRITLRDTERGVA